MELTWLYFETTPSILKIQYSYHDETLQQEYSFVDTILIKHETQEVDFIEKMTLLE